MLGKINKTITFDAVSTIGEDVVVSYTANINSFGGFNCNEDVRNYTLYTNNYDICEKDYMDFRNQVRAMVIDNGGTGEEEVQTEDEGV